MEALRSEVERNLELAGAVKDLVDRERDMLQGDVGKRVVLHRFHTDAWDSLVSKGGLERLAEAKEQTTRCYMHLKEYNELVDGFESYGNRVVYAPLIEGEFGDYGRKELLKIIREKSDRAEMKLRDTRKELESLGL
ncbi:MAG: hypothetical protein SVS85_02705 [Candidatus Nanohaloarchaea archaeon]|nr:hypothetical protein [Candidatus Nanohaloarchaea archaeon]